MDTAKVFMSGRSQAVRLPKGYRFDAEEVCIKRIGEGVLLFPKDKAWDLMSGAIGQVTDDFMEDRSQPDRMEERDGL